MPAAHRSLSYKRISQARHCARSTTERADSFASPEEDTERGCLASLAGLRNVRCRELFSASGSAQFWIHRRIYPILPWIAADATSYSSVAWMSRDVLEARSDARVGKSRDTSRAVDWLRWLVVSAAVCLKAETEHISSHHTRAMRDPRLWVLSHFYCAPLMHIATALLGCCRYSRRLRHPLWILGIDIGERRRSYQIS